ELTENPRSSAGTRLGQIRAALVVGEVALSVLLLIGAGLMIRSLSNLLGQNFGFNPEHLVTFNISLPGKKYSEQANRQRLFDQLLTSVRAIPGVKAAGGVLGLPLGGWNSNQNLEIVGALAPAAKEAVSAGYSQISPGYFSAMNIPFVQGRDFN